MPVAAMVLLLSFDIVDRIVRQRELQGIATASAMISVAEHVGHELQRELGRTSLYVLSGGSLYGRELVDQWEETDKAFASFASALARSEANLGGRSSGLHYSELLDGLEGLGGLRERVLDRDISWSESQTFYSDLRRQIRGSSAGLISTVHPDPHILVLFEGFQHLWGSADAAGLERSLVSKVLAEGTIKREELDQLSRLAGRREESLRSYHADVLPDTGSTYLARLAAIEADPAEAVREQFAEGDFSLDPEAWFEFASISIGALHEVEEDMLRDVEATTTEMAHEARSDAWRFAAFGVVVLASSLLVAHVVGTRLSRRVIRLADVARGVQVGDWSQRAEDSLSDELGVLGSAFDRMVDDLTSTNRTLEIQVVERTSELVASEGRIRAMLEAIPDLIFRLTRDGVYLDFIHTSAKTADGSMIFHPPERFVGKRIQEVLSEMLARRFIAAGRETHLTGEVQYFEYEYPIGGELRDREARVLAIPGSDETMVVVRDITERKADERRLRELVRSQDELIASISHELRTPLTAVMGFAELLRDDISVLSEGEQAEMIEAITAQASDISYIVEDLLVAARAEIGTLHIALGDWCLSRGGCSRFVPG